MEVSNKFHAPTALSPAIMSSRPLGTRLGGLRNHSELGKENSNNHTGNRTSTVQFVMPFSVLLPRYDNYIYASYRKKLHIVGASCLVTRDLVRGFVIVYTLCSVYYIYG
jgi:hypothetical protein